MFVTASAIVEMPFLRSVAADCGRSLPSEQTRWCVLGWLARIGSGLFLILQMVILLDFVQTWNDAWVSMEDENYIYGLLGLTVCC